MNKAELIDALAVRLGDKRTASSALDAVLAEIQAAVTKGDKVAITGFGVFEKRVRAARTARNPRTGAPVKVKKTSVPAFRAGASFKDQVASGRVPKVAAAKKTTTKKATAAKTTVKKAPARKAPAKKAMAKATRAAATPARRTATAKAPAAAKRTGATRASGATRVSAASPRKTGTAKATARKAR